MRYLASLQRKRAVDSDPPRRAETDIASSLATPSSGRPIDPNTRAWLNAGLGHDFANVQVHADGEADRLARALHANAFTTGQDIYFKEHAYDPASPEGLHRLAHEAAHVVQQADGPVTGDLVAEGVSVSHPDDAFEQAAESAADRVMAGISNGGSGSGSAPAAGASSTRGTETQVQRCGDEVHAGCPYASNALPIQRECDPSVQSCPMPYVAPDPGGGNGGSPQPDLGNPAADQASNSAMWDLMGMIPGVGTVTSAVATGYDVVKAGSDFWHGNSDQGWRDLKDASLDALGAVPLAGNLLSAEEFMWDVGATKDREKGASAADAPTFSDVWAKELSFKNLNPFEDPDSWTPRGPAQ